MLRSPGRCVRRGRLGVWLSAVMVVLVAMLVSGVFVGAAGSASGAAGLLAFSSGSGVYVMQPDGADVRPLWRGARLVRDVAWSPDGRRLAVSTSATASDPTAGGIWVMAADGSRAVRVSSVAAGSLTWSPDGQRIAFAWKDDIWVMKPNGAGARHLKRTPRLPERNLDWASTGSIAFDIGGWIPTIFVTKADGSGLRQLEPSPVLYRWNEWMEPDWSPDGRRIAFTYCRNTSKPPYDDCQIAVMNANGKACTRLTSLPWVHHGAPSWSPDGRQIAFVRGGTFCCGAVGTIYVMNADGTGKTALTTATTAANPAWQPSPAT
jgi:Tol biopolymer transport system component